jgi:hypothetical protein
MDHLSTDGTIHGSIPAPSGAPMPPDPVTLAEQHWNALRAQDRARADGLLAELRGLAGEAAGAQACRGLAHALSRAHWDAGRWGDAARSNDLLD